MVQDFLLSEYDVSLSMSIKCDSSYIFLLPKYRFKVEVSMFDWVPKFVVDFMSTKALTDATAWVKKYSEAEAQKRPSKKSAADSTSNTSQKVDKPKNKLFGIFTSKEKKLAEKKIAEEEEAMRIAEEKGMLEAQAKEKLTATWKRLFLIGMVSILFLYNGHLFFSN